ncbi:50S ribosomal protein L24 [Candidatus Microgenomates bacterium]|nr:50S ribosomal protein L24 [Candidatus Microgenomates bacterium]
MTKLRVGDEVLITAGKDKGRRGKVEKMFPRSGRVLIPGLNVYKKHQRALGKQKGGIIEFSRPLPLSNIALLCPHCTKLTRVGMKFLNTGEKVRICRKCGRQIDKESLAAKAKKVTSNKG